MNSRRDFIKQLSRTIFATGIIGCSGYLILRESSGQSCDFDIPCHNCKRLAVCGQSKAKEFKNQEAKKVKDCNAQKPEI